MNPLLPHPSGPSLALYLSIGCIIIAMHIGELAKAAGVNIQTIRFYERQKLLRAPLRTQSGYRNYQQSDLDRLMFIRRNHEIGFTLAEIGQLLHLHAVLETMPHPLKRKPGEVIEIVKLGRQRLEQVNAKIETLVGMKKQLERLVHHLEGKSLPITCPVAQELRTKRPSKSS
jgi:DNA-binding transcriptional MerR regulator